MSVSWHLNQGVVVPPMQNFLSVNALFLPILLSGSRIDHEFATD